jgi:hypothetical protein
MRYIRSSRHAAAPEPHVRRAVRVLAMVGELRRGALPTELLRLTHCSVSPPDELIPNFGCERPAPADFNEPLLIVVFKPFTVGRQRLRFCTSKNFSERFETHSATSFIHSFRILDRVGAHVAMRIGLDGERALPDEGRRSARSLFLPAATGRGSPDPAIRWHFRVRRIRQGQRTAGISPAMRYDCCGPREAARQAHVKLC